MIERRTPRQIRLDFYVELRQLLKRVDRAVLDTPTSVNRTILADCSIVLRNILDGKLIALPE